MITALLGLIAAVTAALISRSVMISNHRQSWINALRDDLAAFFSAIDRTQFERSSSSVAQGTDPKDEPRNEALLTFRKILMRLNMGEPLHQRLEHLLQHLLTSDKISNQENLDECVALARAILKHEWEVTKYGPFTPIVILIKSQWRRRTRISP